MPDSNIQINLTPEDIVKILESVNNRKVTINSSADNGASPPDEPPVLPACGVIICGNGKAGGEI